MHIQLVGIPGSGKSTIVNYLVENSSWFIKPQKITSLKKIIIYHPILFIRVFLYILPISLSYLFIFNKSPITIKQKNNAIKGLIINICNYKIILNKKIDKIILWDEFIYQRLISLFGYEVTLKHLSLFRYYIKKTNKYHIDPIFINTSVSTCFERLKKRGFPKRMQGLDMKKRLLLLELQSQLLQLLINNTIENNKIFFSYNAKKDKESIQIIMQELLSRVC